MKLDNALLDEIAGKVTAGLRTLGTLKSGLDGQVRGVLEGVFANLDIVTDERMQVQEAMLRQARADLDNLEKKVAELEARLNG